MSTRVPILLTGKNGQIGFELERLLPRLGQLVAMNRQELDLSRPAEVRRVIRELRPRLIINAAAYTAVDQAETDQAAARCINAEVPAILAEEAKKIGAALVHYSTDYVFDGSKNSPYLEDDPPNPVSIYGLTKLQGEEAIRQIGVPHLIFRTAWVYATRGRNFLLTILRLGSQKDELRIVSDQVGAPTWCHEIAYATVSALQNHAWDSDPDSLLSTVSGTYHMTASGSTTWFGFAQAICEEAEHSPSNLPWVAEATSGCPLAVRRILPITTTEYPTPARRPPYSVLSNERLFQTFGLRLPAWRDQLHSAFSSSS
jgi:dTDP-4-dehydrorhamnose reductase